MPRSKVRPNVSTYHEAIFMVLEADGTFPGVPLTKSEDKFTTKGVTYLAGRFGLPITTNIQDLYQEVALTYGLPEDFLIRVRSMQQLCKGVEIPASYGTYSTLGENVLEVARITDRIRTVVAGYESGCEDDDLGVDGDFEDYDQCTFEANESEEDAPDEDPEAATYDEATRRKAYEELAAANPLAASFARMIISSTDDDEYEELDEDGVPYAVDWDCKYTDNDYSEE